MSLGQISFEKISLEQMSLGQISYEQMSFEQMPLDEKLWRQRKQLSSTNVALFSSTMTLFDHNCLHHRFFRTTTVLCPFFFGN